MKKLLISLAIITQASITAGIMKKGGPTHRISQASKNCIRQLAPQKQAEIEEALGLPVYQDVAPITYIGILKNKFPQEADSLIRCMKLEQGELP